MSEVEPIEQFTIRSDASTFAKIFIPVCARLYNGSTFSDYTLVLNESERIKAHKVVLFSCSPKFAKLIEENPTELQIKFQNPKDLNNFKILLRFIYTGIVKELDAVDIVPLLSLAFDYQLTSVIESCGDSLEASISVDNVFYFLEVANKFNSKSLLKTCGKFIGAHFDEFQGNGTLQQLTVDSWVGILQADLIKCRGELEIFEMVVDYCLQFKGQARVAALEKLLPLIRYSMMSPKNLFEKVECNVHLSEINCIKDLVFHAYRAKVTGSNLIRRLYGTRGWVFASHPTLGLGLGLTISEDGLTLTKPPNMAQHAMCLANCELEVGQIYYWELTIKIFTSGINIGVVSVDHTNVNSYVGSFANSWDYCNTATKISQGQSVSYGAQYTASDVIGVLADRVEHTLTYFHNGRNLGVAYNLPSSNMRLAPAVSLYNNSIVTLEVKEPPVK